MECTPLLVAGVAAALGALLAGPLEPALTAAALAAAACWIARFRSPAAIGLAAGVASGFFATAHAPAPVREHVVRIACTLIDDGACTADGGDTYAVSSFETLPPIGTRVLIRARMQPFDGARNPGEPDFAALQREHGLTAELAAAHVMGVLPPARAFWPFAIVRARAWALRQLSARLDEPYVSVLAGELWGAKQSLSPQLRSEFQETGTVHILVTAGLHLGVVAVLTLALLKLLRLPRIVVATGAAVAIWFYVVFSGAHLPSVRAAVMVSFGIAAFAAGAAPLSWNAYGAALFFVAVLRPQSIASASFALSFSCVGAILLLGDHIKRALDAFAFPEPVKEALTLATATQIGTWPLTASVFLLFAPYAIVANLLVVPVVGCTMLLGAAQLAASAVAPLADAAAWLNSALLEWIVDAVSTISSMPHATVAMHPPSLAAVASYDAALLFAAYTWERNGRTIGASAVLLAVLCIALPIPAVDGKVHITVLDVGQADAIVIETPRHHTIVVDAGGRLERGAPGTQSVAEQVGERVVVPFLRREGVDRIDALILSHPHGDHAGGIAPVLRAFGVDELADSGQQYGGFAYNDAIQTAKADRVPIVYPRAGMLWRTSDGLSLTFIGPSLPFIESTNTINDNSIAFVLQYKHFRMLFTGDAGVAAEQRFLNEGIDLHADVLKVGHHGSAYSSSPAFIAAVHPRYAVISVGRHNMFGHPAPSTIETLQRFGAQVYRTDQDGAVTIISDGITERVGRMVVGSPKN